MRPPLPDSYQAPRPHHDPDRARLANFYSVGSARVKMLTSSYTPGRGWLGPHPSGCPSFPSLEQPCGSSLGNPELRGLRTQRKGLGYGQSSTSLFSCLQPGDAWGHLGTAQMPGSAPHQLCTLRPVPPILGFPSKNSPRLGCLFKTSGVLVIRQTSQLGPRETNCRSRIPSKTLCFRQVSQRLPVPTTLGKPVPEQHRCRSAGRRREGSKAGMDRECHEETLGPSLAPLIKTGALAQSLGAAWDSCLHCSWAASPQAFQAILGGVLLRFSLLFYSSNTPGPSHFLPCQGIFSSSCFAPALWGILWPSEDGDCASGSLPCPAQPHEPQQPGSCLGPGPHGLCPWAEFHLGHCLW